MMAQSCRRRALLLLFFFVVLAPSGRAEDWPQWRGPNNYGISSEKGLPTQWDATRNVVWKLKMPGMGGSTPIVWKNRIFLTSEDGDSISLLCVGTDGKELWRKGLGTAIPKARTV